MRSAPVSGLSIALRSSLEGTATFSTPARRLLPARFASADPVSHASHSASTDPSRNRSRSPAARSHGLRPRRRRQPSPPPRWRSRRQLLAALGALRAVRSTRHAACCPAVAPGAEVSHRWLPEAQRRLRAGLPAPTGRPDGRRMAGWAEGDAEDAATDGACCTSEPTFERACTCSSVYSSAVTGASQLYI